MLRRPERSLKQQAEAYLKSVAASNIRLRRIFDIFQAKEARYAIFGGVLRDLYLYGNKARPRDIDLVLENKAVIQDIPLRFADSYRKNRFGGLHIKVKDSCLDLWPLEDTWAFRQNLISKHDFEHLPFTSFLNVEAIVAVFLGSKCTQLYSAGFFEAMKEKNIDINLEDNPFPDLCVVRVLAMASQMRFSISQKLTRYISLYSAKFSLDRLQETQIRHYGSLVLSREYIFKVFSEIRIHCAMHQVYNYVPPMTSLRSDDKALAQ